GGNRRPPWAPVAARPPAVGTWPRRCRPGEVVGYPSFSSWWHVLQRRWWMRTCLLHLGHRRYRLFLAFLVCGRSPMGGPSGRTNGLAFRRQRPTPRAERSRRRTLLYRWRRGFRQYHPGWKAVPMPAYLFIYGSLLPGLRPRAMAGALTGCIDRGPGS